MFVFNFLKEKPENTNLQKFSCYYIISQWLFRNCYRCANKISMRSKFSVKGIELKANNFFAGFKLIKWEIFCVIPYFSERLVWFTSFMEKVELEDNEPAPYPVWPRIVAMLTAFVLVAVVFTLVALFNTSAIPKPDPPNIIFILADDLVSNICFKIYLCSQFFFCKV